MAASFLKRKPKEPDGPQRQEIPVLEADTETGLSAAQAQERLDGGWGNAPVESPGASVREIIAKNVFTYFNFLFFLLAGCVIAVRQWLNLTFLGPVFCNMFIGIVQDLRVKKKVDGLKIMAAPKCRAVRDGQIVELDAAQLVRDDIAVFSPGDQIPADAVVAAGECRVNEALVTGEADEIVKKPGERLLSGSFVDLYDGVNLVGCALARGLVDKGPDIRRVEIEARIEIDRVFAAACAQVVDHGGNGTAGPAITHRFINRLLGVQRHLRDLRGQTQRPVRQDDVQGVAFIARLDRLGDCRYGSVPFKPSDIYARNIDVRVNGVLIFEHKAI